MEIITVVKGQPSPDSPVNVKHESNANSIAVIFGVY